MNKLKSKIINNKRTIKSIVNDFKEYLRCKIDIDTLNKRIEKKTNYINNLFKEFE